MPQTDIAKFDAALSTMMHAATAGRAAAMARLSINDEAYARALVAARALKPVLEAKLLGQKVHHDGCLCPNCRDRGQSTIIGVEFPADAPEDRYKIGMANWWKWIARHDDDGSEWRWTFEDTNTIASLVAFRQVFAGIDVPFHQPTPLFTADNPEPFFLYDRRLNFKFDSEEHMGDRSFLGSGRLVVVERDSPMLVRPTGFERPDGTYTGMPSPWVDAQFSIENVATEEGGSAGIAVCCLLNRDNSQRWPDLYPRRLQPVTDSTVEQKWTFYFRCEEQLWPLARVVAFDARSVTLDLDRTVMVASLLQ